MPPPGLVNRDGLGGVWSQASCSLTTVLSPQRAQWQGQGETAAVLEECSQLVAWRARAVPGNPEEILTHGSLFPWAVPGTPPQLAAPGCQCWGLTLLALPVLASPALVTAWL